ncbi:MAG: DNA ligase D [Gaiellales bacterium]|nr:MAG: DNA ligase D [Gaiellales bacterium]
MSLRDYERKRDFAATPEPAPGAGGEPGSRFVLHRHDASHLHYDLRLEHGGALISWAVPKGLPVPHDPRKLAVHVEDHPVEYLDFRGEIPKGQYGAGIMDIWDRGAWEPLDDVASGLEKGKLTFRLHGARVDGEFSLVRMKKGERQGDREWLIILHDPAGLNPELATVGRAAALPATVEPMLATLAAGPFDSPGYLFEVKYDGMRALARLDAGGSLSIRSRKGTEQAPRFPELGGLAGNFLARELIADGEIVALDERGVSRFQLLQERLNLTGEAAIRSAAARVPAYYFVFDLLYLDGRDLRDLPLDERRGILERVLLPHGHVRLSEIFEASGTAFFAAARENGLEGIMAKRRDSPYRGRRSRDWLKVKVTREQEFVVGGYTAPAGTRRHLGALLLGFYEGDDLVFAGSVGSGFSEAELVRLGELLEPLASAEPPFAAPPDGRGVTWVKPELVASVKFAEWTREGSLRQPVYLGLRDDVAPRDVVREQEVDAPPADAAKDRPPSDAPSVKAPLPPPGKDSRRLTLGGHVVSLTHLRKPFWPEEGYTKFDLIDYYYRVAPFLLPHLRGRPLTLKRYPDGYGSEPFFQKEAPTETPDWVNRVAVHSEAKGAQVDLIVCEDAATLLFLANIACISQNPWLSRVGSLESPDHIVFDLDPVEDGGFAYCVEAALLLRDKLASFGLRGYPKTSGASGLHVYVPLKPGYSYGQARQFARVVAILCREERHDLVSLEPSVSRRDAPVYLDILQNARGKTVASVYSVRARAGAPVSTPLAWDEVAPGLSPAAFSIGSILGRLEERGDLFSETLSDSQDLLLALERGEKHLPRR